MPSRSRAAGGLDLIGTASSVGQVMWYENLGGDPDKQWRKHVIDSSAGRVIHGNLVDMDGNGGVDFVAGGRRERQDPR